MMKVLELFSGIGGMHYAAKRSGLSVDVVAAVDVNTVSNTVYRHNFPSVHLWTRNIQSLTPEELNKLKPEMVLMSPPCQPFTRCVFCRQSLSKKNMNESILNFLIRKGLKKDVSDSRSSALLHVIQLLAQLKDLKYVLLENVKGFESSEARQLVVTELQSLGFVCQEFLLSPLQFGIPNARLRYYLLAKKSPLKFCFATRTQPWDQFPTSTDGNETSTETHNRLNETIRSLIEDDRSIPMEDEQLPEEARRTRCHTIRHVMESTEHSESLKDFMLPDKMLGKCSIVLDVVSANSRRSCCFTKAYGHYADGTGSVITDRPLSGVHEVRLRNQDMKLGSSEQISLMRSLHLRYFTPREISRLLCFPEEPLFSFPKSVTRKQCFKLLGNSVNVHVIACLIALLVAGDDV